ncbi:amidophosphoribosyltransferase [Thermosulfuriphilus ammonigenes]|uniref:Amidophosphoribosyltransferase n=1 Tax=Thermosulfuriphilus ammonigenes TaxID=1936021 RepID=A0A6G7PV17_9BACT|nr:amidophosphoribosyltransferase [Thermosulfuriphilus ammonigenes]MBA2848570.1 amidophosphoribosyltransferase [Thermosulfuriphilus ammonigenes]QIJ71288.1 amidophosphoribosyltransferase [Thermosulfuriphilus ammonigenes]
MCGIFGVFGHREAAKLAYFGLYALQHRGQESAGIAVSNGREIREHKGMGLVAEVFDEETLVQLKGHIAVGHVRYSTTGASALKNAQPFCVTHSKHTYGIAHNGNLTNSRELRERLEAQGSIFQTTIDSEIILHLLAKVASRGIEEALTIVMETIEGAYSCLLLTEDKLIAFRDPHGFRPLCLGILNGGYVVASETCALDLIQAQYLRDIRPGEIVIIGKDGLQSIQAIPPSPRQARCIFEFIYFARPDSNVFGENVYLIRRSLGERLAEEARFDCDFVMPFPDSGNYAAVGYARASGLPFEMGVIRNHYVGRTFIQPSQSMRDFSVRVKLNPVKEIIRGQRVLVVDDSIVRGTTSRTRVRAIREAGASKIYMVISCPPIRFPCYFGIDFPSRGELIAARHQVEEIQRYLDLDGLHYLSLEGMLAACRAEDGSFCTACFTGQYPIEIRTDLSKNILERHP